MGALPWEAGLSGEAAVPKQTGPWLPSLGCCAPPDAPTAHPYTPPEVWGSEGEHDFWVPEVPTSALVTQAQSCSSAATIVGEDPLKSEQLGGGQGHARSLAPVAFWGGRWGGAWRVERVKGERGWHPDHPLVLSANLLLSGPL